VREKHKERDRERAKERERAKQEEASQKDKEREMRNAIKKQVDERGRLQRAKERLELEKDGIKEKMEIEKRTSKRNWQRFTKTRRNSKNCSRKKKKMQFLCLTSLWLPLQDQAAQELVYLKSLVLHPQNLIDTNVPQPIHILRKLRPSF
jgi:hypothetical protein